MTLPWPNGQAMCRSTVLSRLERPQAHIKNETPKKALRQEAGMAPPLPYSAHRDQLISAKPRGTARFFSDHHM